jgi:hypothetical protein
MDSFPKTTPEEDAISTQEGLRIFGELRKKYSNNNIRDLDIVLNSLVAALVYLAYYNVGKTDIEVFGDLIRKIFVENAKNLFD